ncbi:hypothetical protein QWY93_13850 [Echinicola jeungdonensis]|uniref:Lipoprotein n=1 Tax=Echinicola jeungdonensis TaxID=709343 RepID=A0ABV5J9J0_9BACT|nr:hypothetical protein [Echinicola jeungdonensis]MDN3670400.1 hypothetical protein [Echinicola jeungdonensis]
MRSIPFFLTLITLIASCGQKPGKYQLFDERLTIELDEGLREKPGSRKMVADSVMGEPCFLTEQTFRITWVDQQGTDTETSLLTYKGA